MRIESTRSEWIRSALFVDFDNIHIGLEEEYGKNIARIFGCDSAQWVEWVERQAVVLGQDGKARPRKLLIRRCYMNPESFPGYRRRFTQAAFEVIDCPPLTEKGKTSTDMHLVMDVLDALADPVHLDEFIIMSGDADFTPLLLRLRRHDRLTAIFSARRASAAYKASSDRIIAVDEFISNALGKNHGGRPNGTHEPQIGPSPTPPPVTVPTSPPMDNTIGGLETPIPYRRKLDKPGTSKLGHLISKIHRATGIPNLSHEQYASLFMALAEEINSKGFDPHETSTAVQQRCAEKKITVMEGDVDTVMEGYHRVEHWFTQGRESVEAISEGYLKHIKEFCRTENSPLGEGDLALLDRWIKGEGKHEPEGSLPN